MQEKLAKPVSLIDAIQEPEELIFPLAIVGSLGWGSRVDTIRDEMH